MRTGNILYMFHNQELFTVCQANLSIQSQLPVQQGHLRAFTLQKIRHILRNKYLDNNEV